MKKIIIFILANVLLVVFLLGFIDIVQDEPIVDEEEFTYSINSMPRDLKVVGSLDKREQDIVCATSRGLIEFDDEGNIQPSLAEGVEVRDNGLEYEFTIKNDVYWSNGEKITPKDVVMFFREILIEEDENNIKALLNVYGATSYRNGIGSFSETVGFSVSENKIKIRLNSPDENFLKELAKPQYRVRDNVLLWEKINDNYSNITYSGNYAIDFIDMNEVVLKKNSSVRNELVDKIKIIQNEETELAMAAFEVGNRDMVIDPPRSQLERLKKDERLITMDSNRAMYMTFNPNSNIINVNGKKEIYAMFNKAFEEYQLQNNIFIELAEGSYFRDDKNDLTKLQNRKVMTNQSGEWNKVDGIKVVALENSYNKELCEYLSNWFNQNSTMYMNYNLLSEEEMKNIHKETYYNVALLECETKLDEKSLFYSSIKDYIPSEYKELLKVDKSKTDLDTVLGNLEDNLFNSYSFLPLVFYNDNIATNGNKNIDLDVNENIDFNKLEK